MESFWFRFFQKANGVKRGRAPEKTALFFLRSFFFCASCVKRKSDIVDDMVLSCGKENFFEKSFSSSKPHLSKTLKKGIGVFFILCAPPSCHPERRAKPEVEPRRGVRSTGSTRGINKAVRDPATACRAPRSTHCVRSG